MTKPYVYVTRKVPDEILKDLSEVAEVGMWREEGTPVPREILEKEAKRAAGLITMLTEKVDRSLLEEATSLQVVANVAVGHDNVDIGTATEKGVAVCNTPDVLTDTTADLTFALLMAAARRMVEAAQYIKDDKWKNWSPFLLAGNDVHHKTIGIVGMGRIGEAVAKRATGFDMKILYHNRSRKPETEKMLGAAYVEFEELLERADFIVCLTPLTSETEGLFDMTAFKRMKRSAVFVNVSRGPVVDEAALLEALNKGEIAAVGLDVFANEPISADHPLLQHENVVALPHIGSASLETRKEMIELACRNTIHVLQGKKPETMINSEILP
jgi:glyoxylate reductase